MEEQDNIIILEDEHGNAKEFTILFTYESEETGKKYVYYYDSAIEDEDEDLVMNVSIYDDDNNIFFIESDEELAQLEEIYNAFIAEQGLGIDE
ncbi:DUF1292 domain-containing protein [Erysipelotrichaceae bacterium OttesenSCG-928-M19]|nr:DUF1292 domain-containing protein [Erysipelotrichaceae bacterium OttesenSCG-928-M19]